ncbi:MAG: GNAT family N-acetyltransferase [Bdellovibrionota bacterium]
MNPIAWTKLSYTISTDPTRLSFDVIFGFLSGSYWNTGIARETCARSIQNSLCFGIYDAGQAQIGFARVISDFATFAYLADVFVLEPHRQRGLSKWLLECILSHPNLQGLKRFLLATKDAHRLYEKVGFEITKCPESWMEIFRPYS